MSYIFNPRINSGVPEISAEEFYDEVIMKKKKVVFVDVRTPEEFCGELGHIPGAQLIEMGPAFTQWLQMGNRDQEVILICRSGNRSGNCTATAQYFGYRHVINLAGGMLRWNELGFPLEKEKE